MQMTKLVIKFQVLNLYIQVNICNQHSHFHYQVIVNTKTNSNNQSKDLI